MHLRLDAPIDQALDVTASCDWLDEAGASRLGDVETDRLSITIDGKRVSIRVSPDIVNPEGADVSIWVEGLQSGDFYQSGSKRLVVARQAADGSSGVIRLRGLAANGDVRLQGQSELSGVVRWTCPPPLAPPAATEPQPGPEPLEIVDGTATVTMDPSVVAPFEGDIACELDRGDPAYLRVAGLTGRFTVAGGEIQFVTASDVLVSIVDRDGQPSGEYVGAINRISDELTGGPLLIEVDELSFEPTDPTYVPLGGPNGPRLLSLRIDYECDVPQGARPEAPTPSP